MSKGNIRLISIVAIVVLFLLSWYSLIDNSIKDTRLYNGYITTAREKADSELYDDAQDNYMNALNMRDSLELRGEIADFYKTIGKESNYVGFCEQIVEKYPYDNLGYERLVEYYKEKANYKTCFSFVEKASKRGVESQKIKDIANELAYEYELSYFAFEKVSAYSGGLYPVKKTDGYWGYVNAKGSTQISFTYEDADCFTSSGLAAIKTQEGKYFLIDTSNRKKVVSHDDRKIEDCTNLISGKIAVKYDGKYHYCDSEFKELFGSYDYAGAFYCGVAAVKDGENWFIINEKGEKVSDKSYQDIKVDEKGIAFRNNVAFAKQGEKYILIDTSGNQVGSESWDDADAFNSDQPAAVKKGELWGYADHTGNIVLKYKYESAKSFSNNMAAVARNNKWGYISIDEFEEKIECSFQDAKDFNDSGSAFVFSNNKWTLLKLYRLCR